MYKWNTSGVLAEKPDFAKCNHPPVHPTPPPGHPHNTSIYKGATSRKSTYFPLVYAYPKQGYNEYQKIHSEHYTIPFSKAITPKERA